MDKTPISRLHEICARNNLQPEYQLLSVEGVVHAPTFVYRVNVGGETRHNSTSIGSTASVRNGNWNNFYSLVEFVTTANGQSKKKAKHAVAKAMIEKLMKESNYIVEDKDELQEYLDVVESLDGLSCKDEVELEEANDLNPVGKLQEVCMKKRWRPPQYKTISEDGLPHERIFRMECFLENMSFTEIGAGKSKRLAKRKAACNMLKRLKDENLCDDNENLNNTKKELPVYSQDIDDWFKQNYKGKRKAGIEKIDNFYLNLAKRSDKEIDAIEAFVNNCLNSVESDYDAIAVFIKLADLLNCSVRFGTLPELNVNNDYQSLVQLFPDDDKYTGFPILTSWGTGQTTDEAKQSAAFRAFSIYSITFSNYKHLKQLDVLDK